MSDDFDTVRGIARLQGVDGEVEEDLEEVGTVDEGNDVGVEVLDGEFVAFAAWVFDEKFLEVGEDLVDGDVAVEVSLAGAEVAQITAGNLNAADDLAVDAGDAAAHFFEFIAFHGGGVVHLSVEEFDEAVDDGEGAVQIVEDAAVDGPRFFSDVCLFPAMLEFALEAGELSLDFDNVEVGAPFFECLGGGSA